MSALIRTDTYEKTVINHDTARQCIERLGNPDHSTRIVCIEGEPETGKTHIIKWLADGATDLPISIHAYPDNATIEVFLAEFSNFLLSKGVPLVNFQTRLNPSPPQAEIAENSTRLSQGTFFNAISIGITDPNASPHQIQLAYYSLFDAIIDDLREYADKGVAFAGVLLLDKFDRWDHTLARFLTTKVLPDLLASTDALVLIAGNSCRQVTDDLLNPEDRTRVEVVQLRRFRRPEEIVAFVKQNAEVNFGEMDLHAWAEKALEECDGRPIEVANRVRVILDLRRKI